MDERLEKLAEMVKRGFDDVPSRADLDEFRRSMEGKLRVIASPLARLERDTLELQGVIRPLAHLVPEHDERLDRIEKHVGLAK